MPEFVLDRGDAASAAVFKALDYFTQGYIEAMFFTGDYTNSTFADLAAKTLAKIVADCGRITVSHASLLASVMRSPSYDHEDDGYGLQQAGCDFWYTRNGHGTGFWDRDLGEAGDKLTEIARSFGKTDLYAGDDNLLYLS